MFKISNLKTFVTVSIFCVTTSFAAEDSSDASRTNSSVLPKPGPVTVKDQWKPHFGLLAGSVHPEGRYDAGAGYGVDIGFQPYIPFGFGLEVTKSENEGQRDREDLEQTAILAKATYNFGGSNFFLKNTYVGIAAGQVQKSGHSDIAGAPLVGFDLPLQEKAHNYLTLGASAKHLIINGNDPDVLMINGVVKYWY